MKCKFLNNIFNSVLHEKKQKKVTDNPDKNQSIETNSEMAHTCCLVYKDYKAAYINMKKYLKNMFEELKANMVLNEQKRNSKIETIKR